MPATSPDIRLKNWADSILLRPPEEMLPGNVNPPRFELVEVGWPDPGALALAVVFLSVMASGSIVLSRYQKINSPPRTETTREFVLAPRDQDETKLVAPEMPKDSPDHIPPSAEPVTADLPTPELAEIRPPSAPVQPSQSEPLRPTPLKAEPTAGDSGNDKSLPHELMETPPPTVPDSAAHNIPRATPFVELAKSPATTVAGNAAASAIGTGSGLRIIHSSRASDSSNSAGAKVQSKGPESLGVLPLSDLINDEAGLAAGLNALPAAQRVNLPRVSIRVNAEWFATLSQTQERLYFSVTPPQGEGEVLAYVPGNRSFELERPERPLWQIRGADGVPVLAEIRAAAGRALGVSPELVGVYTWHPPVLENALRMFVLERMQEMHVQLGPRDMVTVRLATGPGGTVMNLEPIREVDFRQ